MYLSKNYHSVSDRSTCNIKHNNVVGFFFGIWSLQIYNKLFLITFHSSQFWFNRNNSLHWSFRFLDICNSFLCGLWIRKIRTRQINEIVLRNNILQNVDKATISVFTCKKYIESRFSSAFCWQQCSIVTHISAIRWFQFVFRVIKTIREANAVLCLMKRH